MVVTVAVAGIGAAHRREGLDHVGHRRAESFQHRLDDMVAQDEDAVGLDRGGEMAVADVPGEFGEMHRVARADVVELLRRGDDLDVAAVVQHQHGRRRRASPARAGRPGPCSPSASSMTRRRRCRSSCGSTATSKGSGAAGRDRRRAAASPRAARLVKSVLRESFMTRLTLARDASASG